MVESAALTNIKTMRARKRPPRARRGGLDGTCREVTVRCCRGHGNGTALRGRAVTIGMVVKWSQGDWSGAQVREMRRPMERGTAKWHTVPYRAK